MNERTEKLIDAAVACAQAAREYKNPNESGFALQYGQAAVQFSEAAAIVLKVLKKEPSELEPALKDKVDELLEHSKTLQAELAKLKTKPKAKAKAKTKAA